MFIQIEPGRFIRSEDIKEIKVKRDKVKDGMGRRHRNDFYIELYGEFAAGENFEGREWIGDLHFKDDMTLIQALRTILSVGNKSPVLAFTLQDLGGIEKPVGKYPTPLEGWVQII